MLLALIGTSACAAAVTPSAEPSPSGSALLEASPIPPSSIQASPSATTPASPLGPVTAVLVGAGDIADCDRIPSGDSAAAATALLVERIPGTVFTAGDAAYEVGSPANFADCYDPTWGAFKDRTLLPATGNHEYKTPGATGYFDYFGSSAGTRGEGWYSTDIGTWHIVVLNANCTIVGCGPGSPQLDWLSADLAAHPAACTLAIWHQPRFSSGYHRDDLSVAPFWDVLAAAHADLVINGHDHDYERFAPQDPSGRLDPVNGIREIVVGTGGATLRPFATVLPNREVASDTTHGVIVLTLHAGGYDWWFEPDAGETFTDSGSAACH